MEININCEKHLNQKIFLFCLNKECQNSRLMCHKCNSLHENHSFCTFKNVYQMTTEIKKNYNLMWNRFQDIHQEILCSLNSFEKKFQRILENFYRISFISNIETTLIENITQNQDTCKQLLEKLAEKITVSCEIQDGKLKLKDDPDQIKSILYNIEKIIQKFKILNEMLNNENKHIQIEILSNFNQQSLVQSYQFYPKKQLSLLLQCKQKFILSGVAQCFVSLICNEKKKLNLEYNIQELNQKNVLSCGNMEKNKIFKEKHCLDFSKIQTNTTCKIMFSQEINLFPNNKYIISVKNCMEDVLQLTYFDNEFKDQNKYFDVISIEQGQFPYLLIRDIK